MKSFSHFDGTEQEGKRVLRSEEGEPWSVWSHLVRSALQERAWKEPSSGELRVEEQGSGNENPFTLDVGGQLFQEAAWGQSRFSISGLEALCMDLNGQPRL